MNHTTERSALSSPTTSAQLKEISYCPKQNEQNIKLMGMIAKLDVSLQSCTIDVREGFARVFVELNTQLEYFRPAKSLLCPVYQKQLLSSEDQWIEEIVSAEKLATGIAFYEGNKSIPIDFQKAARFLNAALNEGNSEAYYYLGMLYRSGRGVQQCNVTAFEYFEKVARSKDPKSMAELSVCYLYGAGVEACDPLGVAYAKMSAEAGNPRGMALRADHKLHGIITDKNVGVAFDYTKKAVERGNINAKLLLSIFYFHGLVVDQNQAEAIRLWTESIGPGGYSCIVRLAPCYEHGLGVDVDLQKGAELYSTGSQMPSDSWRKHHIQAFYGMCLVRGRGVKQDVKEG